jgi:hypothetical protein
MARAFWVRTRPTKMNDQSRNLAWNHRRPFSRHLLSVTKEPAVGRLYTVDGEPQDQGIGYVASTRQGRATVALAPYAVCRLLSTGCATEARRGRNEPGMCRRINRIDSSPLYQGFIAGGPGLFILSQLLEGVKLAGGHGAGNKFFMRSKPTKLLKTLERCPESDKTIPNSDTLYGGRRL